MSWIENILKIVELKTRYFFVVWVFGTLLIFLPDAIKIKMAITIPEVVRPYVGFTTLATFVMWFVLITIQSFEIINKKIKERRKRDTVLDQLKTLSIQEKNIFIFCLDKNQRTIQKNITDTAINSLMSKGLMTVAPQGHILAMPYTIPKFVWDYIQKNKTDLFPELSNQKAMNDFYQRQKNSWMSR